LISVVVFIKLLCGTYLKRIKKNEIQFERLSVGIGHFNQAFLLDSREVVRMNESLYDQKSS